MEYQDEVRSAFEDSCKGEFLITRVGDDYGNPLTSAAYWGYKAATAAAEEKYLGVIRELSDAVRIMMGEKTSVPRKLGFPREALAIAAPLLGEK